MKMVMVNKINKRKSMLQINKIRLRSKIPARYFTLRFLERRGNTTTSQSQPPSATRPLYFVDESSTHTLS